MHPKLRAFLSLPDLRQWRRVVLRTLLAGYIGLLLFAWLFANAMLFHPPHNTYSDTPDLLKLPSADGNKITARFLPNPKATHVLLFSHGNAEDLGGDEDLLREFQQHGWAVLAYDYPGYGTSTGQPSESGCDAAIDAAYDYLVNVDKIPPAQIVLYGRSLGSGPSIDLASRQPVGGLILEGAFTSVFRVMTHYRIAPWDKFNNIAKIPLIHVPLLSIHARNDHVVPFWHGEALYDAYTGPKQNLWVDNVDHNGIMEAVPDAYWGAIEKFQQSLPPTGPLKIPPP